MFGDDWEFSQPIAVYDDERGSATCPDCGEESLIYRCLHCGREHNQGDQAFLEVDVPYGSIVHDRLFGPAYFCSSKHLVEFFANDDFDAVGMIGGTLL